MRYLIEPFRDIGNTLSKDMGNTSLTDWSCSLRTGTVNSGAYLLPLSSSSAFRGTTLRPSPSGGM